METLLIRAIHSRYSASGERELAVEVLVPISVVPRAAGGSGCEPQPGWKGPACSGLGDTPTAAFGAPFSGEADGW